MLVDLRNSELTGKVAQETLDQAHITVNKNTVPFETRSPFVTSGVRIGTPAVTTRGMKEPEMEVIAELIARALQPVGDDAALALGRRRRRLALPEVPDRVDQRDAAEHRVASRVSSGARRLTRRPRDRALPTLAERREELGIGHEALAGRDDGVALPRASSRSG